MTRPLARRRGQWFEVDYAVRTNGKSPGKEFYDELSDSDKAKLNALFERLADSGKIVNEEKFKKLQDELFEFKSGQVRMPCIFVPRKGIVRISHGFWKKSGKAPSAEITRAKAIFAEDTQWDKR